MPTSIRPLISVVIPAYNEEKFLGKCLDSLRKQDLDKKYFEVIVVDNASTDKTGNVAKKYPFKLIREPRRSVVIARQAAVNSSKGQIIVSADADTIYPPNWLRLIKEDFEKNPQLIALVGWTYYRKTPAWFNIIHGFNQEFNLFLLKYTGKFPLVYAANFSFRKTSLEKIGGYPTHLPELGDQQYLLHNFQKLGPVQIDPRVQCFTSARRYSKPLRTIFVDNGWYRLIGYTLNRLLDREVIGAAPAVRTTSGIPGRSKFLARLKRIS